MEKDEYLKQKIKDFEHKHYYMGYLEKSNDPQLKRNWKCELQQKHLK